MTKKIYLEIDKGTFEKIVKNQQDKKGIYDNQRMFSGLNKGDSAILLYNNNKIEAYIEDIVIYDTIEEFMKGENMKMFSLDCNNPFDMMEIIEQIQENSKKLRIYRVKYFPYGKTPPTSPAKKISFQHLAKNYFQHKGTSTDDFNNSD